MKITVSIIALSMFALAACKEERVTRNENTVSPYVRTVPITGQDGIGLGIGMELSPHIYLDMGSGQLNFGVGF